LGKEIGVSSLAALQSQIRAWDQKSAHAIMCIYTDNAAEPDFAKNLVAMAATTDLETGATWLLKHRLETTKDGLESALTRQLLLNLAALTSWEAKLHCLQVLPHLVIPEDCAGHLYRFAFNCSRDTNKFIRAWAYSGLHQLGLVHPAYRDQVWVVLQEAAETEHAASVKVRLRRALEQGFPNA
jgi:hypothetical protein